MAKKRLSMNKIREIIRLHEESQLSYRKIARVLRVSHPIVSKYITDFKATGLKYADVKDISDTDLLELSLRRKRKSQQKGIKVYRNTLSILYKN